MEPNDADKSKELSSQGGKKAAANMTAAESNPSTIGLLKMAQERMDESKRIVEQRHEEYRQFYSEILAELKRLTAAIEKQSELMAAILTKNSN